MYLNYLVNPNSRDLHAHVSGSTFCWGLEVGVGNGMVAPYVWDW